MFNIPRKIAERIQKSVPKFQKILKITKDRDVNESDTVAIVNDMLGEILGYDKYQEVTRELAIRGTYCDLAIKIDEKIHFLIECKAIGLDLKDAHLKQAIDYGANKGIQWVILTNGIKWNVYKIRFEQPINYDLVFNLDFEIIDSKNDRDLEMLYVLSKEGLEKNARDELYDKTQCINKFVIGNMILTENVISVIRKEIKKFVGEIKIDPEEIIEIIEREIIKREIIDSEDALVAQDKLKKYFKKIERQNRIKDNNVVTNKNEEIIKEPNVQKEENMPDENFSSSPVTP
jgi:hypothetical protein